MKAEAKFRFIYENSALDDLFLRCGGNVELATFGGTFWWDVLVETDGWKFEQNKITGHVRILNPSGIRKAWGKMRSIDNAMDVVISRIRSERYARRHDVAVMARMEKLQLLLEKGLITEEEFEQKRSAILDEV